MDVQFNLIGCEVNYAPLPTEEVPTKAKIAIVLLVVIPIIAAIAFLAVDLTLNAGRATTDLGKHPIISALVAFGIVGGITALSKAIHKKSKVKSNSKLEPRSIQQIQKVPPRPILLPVHFEPLENNIPGNFIMYAAEQQYEINAPAACTDLCIKFTSDFHPKSPEDYPQSLNKLMSSKDMPRSLYSPWVDKLLQQKGIRHKIINASPCGEQMDVEDIHTDSLIGALEQFKNDNACLSCIIVCTHATVGVRKIWDKNEKLTYELFDSHGPRGVLEAFEMKAKNSKAAIIKSSSIGQVNNYILFRGVPLQVNNCSGKKKNRRDDQQNRRHVFQGEFQICLIYQ